MYEWLRDYQRIEDDIAHLEFNLEQSTKELKRWVDGDLKDVKLTADSNGAKLEERIDRIQKELKIKQNERENFIKLISKFKGLDNQLLRLKYIDGMTLEEIAIELNYSASYISKKHADIVKMIKFAHEIKHSLF